MQQWEILLDLDDVTTMLVAARADEVFAMTSSRLQVTHVDKARAGLDGFLVRICVTEVADG
jgi:hypothetical protein